MTTVTFVDDYPAPGLGHHPDLLVGLAEATLRLASPGGPTRIHCPSRFIADRVLPVGIEHHPFRRAARATPAQHRERMSALCHSAAKAGADVLVNLFFDDSHESFPVSGNNPHIVQMLHRPKELADEVAGMGPGRDRDMAAYLRRTMPDGHFVVHTEAAYNDAVRWLAHDRVLLLPWPAASITEVAERFANALPSTNQEPHALLIGDARDAKGVNELHAALAQGGPLLRIVGQQPDGVESALQQRYPTTRVEWETGWISRSRLSAAIGAASVVVFPYLKTFGHHGGVSGALAQALTFGKPLVVSSVLADQLPASNGVRIVEPGDVSELRHAVEWAVSGSAELHRLAANTFNEVCESHTYDRHLARILARIAA